MVTSHEISEMFPHEIDEDRIVRTIAEALDHFYTGLIDKLDNIKLDDVIKNKNPYMFYAKGTNSASDIIDSILSATISSSEETIFGNVFFEPLAISASGGQKSMAEGGDIEIETDDKIIFIAVKSGTSVYNSDSKKRQEQNFDSARKRAQQVKKVFIPIIGYGYGKKKSRGSKSYYEFAGQDFWESITGDPEFYKKIIHYMDGLPQDYLEKFNNSYENAKNRLILVFISHFCKEDGSIDWDYLLEYNSSREKVKKK